jgi:outer membrane protein OmpA-like peptidoglycan-associated protein
MPRQLLYLVSLFILALSVVRCAVADQSYEEGPLPPGAKLETSPIKVGSVRIELPGVKIGLSAQSLGITAPGISVKESELEITLSLSGDVLFDFDKATIRSDARIALEQIEGALKRIPNKQVTLVGYTDSKGDDTYNLRLSLKRAEAVMEWLKKRPDLRKFQFRASGQGEKEPVAPNNNPDGSDSPEGRQKNRRVEIRVLKR